MDTLYFPHSNDFWNWWKQGIIYFPATENIKHLIVLMIQIIPENI